MTDLAERTAISQIAYNAGLEIRYAIARSGIDPIQHIQEVDAIIERRLIEARREALDDLLADFDALDAARHLMQWMDMYSRPTEKNLREHCARLHRDPPEECRDVDHVPPKDLRTFWILREVVASHRARRLAEQEGTE